MINNKEIVSINEIKNLSIKELEEQADLIRNYIIDNVSHTGGHLSANLGVVELTIAIHYVFNSPTDKIIFDVGHQVYTHKILTDRKESFLTLRQYNGLSGFPKVSESIHDVWETGHSSTALGAALGMVEAKKLDKSIGEIIALVGDGSIQNGLSLSALNFLASKKDEKVIIILNDNEMSISKNVGGLSDFFNKLRIRKSYSLFRRITPKFIRNTFKMFVYKNDNLFTNLGFKYFGPIDGHDLKSLIKYLEYAKNYNKSIILHVKTTKGKGYLPSEMDCVGKWHGVGPFDKATGEQNQKYLDGYSSWSEEIGKILLEEVEKNKSIKIISPAMIHGSGLDLINEKMKDSIIDVGINEELACLMAAAMSKNKIIPIVSIYSTFIQRSYDILNHDISRTDAHVIFMIDRSGIISGDGSTHQGIYDISITCGLPNFYISMPRSIKQAKELLDKAILTPHPFIIRYPKGKVLLSNDIDNGFTINDYSWEIMLPIASDVCVITYGDDANEFYYAIKNSGKNIGLVNALFIKPIDFELIEKLNNKKVIVYEEVIKNGSLGSMISEYILEKKLSIEFKHFAIDDVIVQEGSVTDLKNSCGLNIKEIIEKI